MNNIRYYKGNILNAVKHPRIIIQSCNCNGSWGGGIAYQLATHYPRAEDMYVRICSQYNNALLGKCVLIPSYEDENQLIACLFTSSFGGASHDTSSDILKYTKLALLQLNKMIRTDDLLIDKEISSTIETMTDDIRKPLSKYSLEMPKINSGIFGVPWEKSEAILKEFEAELEFVVYEL
ncbi:hypothetical protein TPHA_0A04210 [Tetrapisispora phaffii CBS 4417]|uniref:ADP-ribose 1''-phosphate phosphatase n=1 Tax=Tetrapisispora phaffii (strain ATCC 24235 / CBS 4417 / NBRC 1672 / NRRL Y-8282 / UCD 70-5) TaxID=1071381 RepID=G8BNL8_TETPH|nr:hypothetical protein TPHA_0A04210 [Tetrapisispora phaffii CBS 4417]CCE61496.1 hypothetical protein TPHA_0A04210 [Tetrapisispora phaffii CBS 4417]